MEKNNQPLVSVVIPCYNHEHFVQDCIQSVIDQTYENIELIIIDDGSKDNSVEKISQMIPKCEKRFTRFEFRCRPNKGLSATLNEAIQWCKGDYFSIIASDDLMLEKKTAIQVDFLEKNLDTVALFGSADYIDENNNIKSQNSLKEKEYVFDKIFLNECAFFAPTQMLRMNTLLKIGGFDEKILVEDWYMWLKMAEEGRVYCLSDKLAKYRIHSNNSTKNAKFIYDNNLKTLNNYRNYKLYDKAYNKIRWIYITWTGQVDKKKSVKLMLDFLREKPGAIFSIYFLMFCKYYIFKMKKWF
ncbi:glycosyltransferase [Acinetobacter celticus]|uniref:Glycosyl transferase family 2 n=1 Tax=Acinetobacter celticus TaxID=1891224 RepID=A0A1C3D0S0_9GAMM|nr:glycosyltransferase [Acinetobacter celticus]ODA14598.1 glycosyl transferase family 2 [Acinetobacter celticus]